MVLDSYKGETLELHHVQRMDMGAYYCIASNGVPPTTCIIPQVKVTSQLVGAPLGSDVQLQCFIEASPRAMNSWNRENGLLSDKLLENSKFRVSEVALNEYSLWLNLTIVSLAPADYGVYVCSSVNGLGKMESQVSLHRLELSAGGFGAEEPMASGAAWQRARSSPPPRARPAASHARLERSLAILQPYIIVALLTLCHAKRKSGPMALCSNLKARRRWRPAVPAARHRRKIISRIHTHQQKLHQHNLFETPRGAGRRYFFPIRPAAARGPALALRFFRVEMRIVQCDHVAFHRQWSRDAPEFNNVIDSSPAARRPPLDLLEKPKLDAPIVSCRDRFL
ncbi:Lachesin [Eumeta japonica]|uniref:Lachesin n=1 Tax=Eumeta variegata TaxID=151549 RepID=A0A4C1XB29_EUMVA|nr:Lachesin [Eumeta japonica]